MSDPLPPMHAIVVGKVRCAACDRVLEAGARIALRPHPDGDWLLGDRSAEPVCANCHIRGQRVWTPHGHRIVDHVADGCDPCVWTQSGRRAYTADEIKTPLGPARGRHFDRREVHHLQEVIDVWRRERERRDHKERIARLCREALAAPRPEREPGDPRELSELVSKIGAHASAVRWWDISRTVASAWLRGECHVDYVERCPVTGEPDPIRGTLRYMLHGPTEPFWGRALPVDVVRYPR